MSTKPTYDFSGKSIFITGASAGIGQATALLFGKAKANVMIADVNTEGGTQAMRMIRENGGIAEFVQCNVANEAEVKAAIQSTVQAFGGLDYAFNNAGIEGHQSPTAESTSENWERVQSINLKGVWHCMKYEIPEMLKRGGGSIVNCSSIAGLAGFTNIPAYVSSKHGVVGLTKAAALEYAKSNIRVNAVCPGVIQTSMIERFFNEHPEALQPLQSAIPLGRIGRPEEIGQTVMWMCSEASSFLTGQALAVDGGHTTP